MKFKGRLISVETKKQRLPNGQYAEIDIVRHPGAVLIVPFINAATVVLLRQYRPVIKKYLYEFPAGTLGVREKPRACARREIIEETNYRAGKLTQMGTLYPVPGYSTEMITVFKAEKLTQQSGIKDADEIIDVHCVTKPQMRALVKKGAIHDAKTLSALVLCGWL